ncbi:hypothetical protein GCK32_017255 [Trichostrongylus colubriformis]|uniref:Uncharacterized protein n=1 Tax=Trichostrongylus colubriformis TaxID=6319 RepID=A0AAN8FKX7_TRICO
MQIQDIIAFRQHAVRLTTELLDHRFRDDSDELQTLPRTPPGAPATRLLPPCRKGVFPVLYQIVNRNYGQGVILEAKDFFIPGPDHRELQCLPMTQESVNYITRTRGFDKHLLSVKDFVWVLSLRPTHKTLNTWDRETVLRRSRIPRSSVLDSGYPYFFRVHEFVLVTPPQAHRSRLGIVLAVNRRGPNAEVNNIHAAFEGSREAVRVTQSICDFPLDQAEREDLLLADVRPNVSCAMRFSLLAISVTALQYLTNAVRRFLPAHPDEAILPLRIEKCRPESMEWVQERLGSFTSYVEQPRLARRRMAQLFAMASAALAAQATLAEDRSTHHVTATIPSLDSVPLRLFFELPAMTVEGGWSRGRQADIWIVDSNVVLRTRVAGARFAMADQVIRVELHSIPRTHDALRNTARRYGAVAEGRADFKLPICVRLARVPTGTDPVFEFLAQDDLVTSLRPAEQTLAHAILDAVYASAPRPPSSTQSSPAPVAPPLAVRRTGTTRTLCPRPPAYRASAIQPGGDLIHD